MIYIDGAYGEGGQVLRTSLSLAIITNQPIRIERIRAGRQKSGLAAQHLTAVRAAAAIYQTEVQGDALGSMTLEFISGVSAQAGRYTFDVTQAREGGSAGAVTLGLQTILISLGV
jgi:RNA 3'-terminal phosphate cyclase (ATP)